MSLIFEGVLDAFKLIAFLPSFKHNSPSACADHAKCHQGQQSQSGTSKSSSRTARIPKMSSIFEGFPDAFKLIIFQTNFQHTFKTFSNYFHNMFKHIFKIFSVLPDETEETILKHLFQVVKITDCLHPG